jgi:maltose/maltodextrin transport system substrate-binding protein
MWGSMVAAGETVDVTAVDGKLQRAGWTAKVWQRFMHPPVFQFEPLVGAASYHCMLSRADGGTSQTWIAQARRPEVDLQNVWPQLPPAGRICVSAEARDAHDRTLGRTNFIFTRIASFAGPYRPAKRGYIESGALAAQWAMTNAIYAYPALFFSTYINTWTTYARMCPQNADAKTALALAVKYGDLLLKESMSSNCVYAYMPLCNGNGIPFLQVGRGGMVGMAYMELFRATGEKRFLDGAIRIAETLKKTQLPDGRWYFRVDPVSGKMLADYTSDQAEAIALLDELCENYGRREFAKVRDRAVAWMLANPCRTFMWQQQYDDVGDELPYKNLEWFDTAWFIEYLLRHATWFNGYEKTAQALFCYIEDQFVEWEPSGQTRSRITPGAREQYLCYDIITGHAAHFVRVCLAFHRYTQDEIYLRKARAMADTLTALQFPNGRYPTFGAGEPSPNNPLEIQRPIPSNDKDDVWVNCAAYNGTWLMKLGEYLRNIPESKTK